MSEAAPVGETPPERVAEHSAARSRGLLSDPVVRYMVYASLGLIILYLAAAIGVLGTGIARHSSPRTRAEKELMVAAARLTPQSKGDAWVHFKSEYYLYGIVFLIFDVESIFLLPFAAAFTGVPVGGFLAMMLFLLLLVEGLVWAWKKGVLTWR